MNFCLTSACFKTGVMILRAGQTYVLGRSGGCDIFVPSKEASRKHGSLIWEGAGFSLNDLGSSNGIRLNAKPMEGKYILRDGDIFEIGSTEFIYIMADNLVPIIESFRTDRQKTDSMKITATSFAGNITGGDLLEMVQMLEVQAKTGILRISNKRDYGELHFKEGMIVDARYPDLAGEDAALALIRFETGKFEFYEEPVRGAPNVSIQPSALLMNVARESDESEFDQTMGLLDSNPIE